MTQPTDKSTPERKTETPGEPKNEQPEKGVYKLVIGGEVVLRSDEKPDLDEFGGRVSRAMRKVLERNRQRRAQGG